MSVGKFTSLEEVRKDPKLLKRFIKERVAAGHGEGNETDFKDTLGFMLKNSPATGKTSPVVSDADCSGTELPQILRGGASRKR